MTNSTLTLDQQLTSISRHSAAFAEVVAGHFDAPVSSCPGWSVADLVNHVTEVHWHWRTIVDERLTEEPAADDPRHPKPLGDEAAMIDRFRRGAAAMIDVFRAADQSASCWTWAPSEQNVAFITRHQVQEIAVHHWDAVNAVTGGTIEMEPAVAADAITEFLTFSVSSDTEWEAPAGRAPLDGRFRLRATDAGMVWTVHAGKKPITIAFEAVSADQVDEAGLPEITGTAAELLLWLFGRIALDTAAVDAVDEGLMGRFRQLCFTD